MPNAALTAPLPFDNNMSRKRRSNYYSSYSSSYQRRGQERRIPSPVPYLLIALIAVGGLAYFHVLVFKSLHGKLINAYTGGPMPDITLDVTSVADPGSPPITNSLQLTATTSTDGAFNFDKLPPNPVLSVDVDGFASQEITVADRSNLDIKLVPNVLSGRVATPDGKPIGGATVWAGTAVTVTQPDGQYELKDIPTGSKLVVKSPGYLANSVQVGEVVTQDISLQPFVARAIYMNADSIATPGKLQSLLAMVDSTELTAVVIDVKSDNGYVLYDSKLPDVQQYGAVKQIIPDLDGLLANLKQRNVYTIARISVFWDQALTAAKPDWGLKSKKAPGQLWTDPYGKHWANPYMPEVWDYNINIAKEVASRGFDEVLFDSAQFPSDGPLDDIDFGPAQAGRKRVDAIAGFLDRAYRQLSPGGTYLSYNTFGLVPWVQDDMGVGQLFESLAAHVDYVSPDIYPSIFDKNFLNGPVPEENPGVLVSATMKQANERLGGTPAKVRPWLQDFDGPKVKYDAAHVRAEIDAAEQNGAVGWMLGTSATLTPTARLSGNKAWSAAWWQSRW